MEFTNSKYILFIIVFTIIYLYIFALMFSNKLTEYLDENWREIRCYPHILPIAGLSSKADGDNFFSKTFSNFNRCTHEQLNGMLGFFTKPLLELVRGMSVATSSIRNIINSFRSMARVIREMFAALVENTYSRISNSYAAVIYMQEKLKTVIKRQSAMFEVISQFLSSLPFLFYSFSNGPIPRFGNWLQSYIGVLITLISICLLCLFGGPFVMLFACPICALCFDGDTLVNSSKGYVHIRDLEINDVLGDSVITGKIVIKRDLHSLYRYNGIVVSGNHMVSMKDSSKNTIWRRVEDIPSSKAILKCCDIICFTTNNHIININGTIFKDYRETDNIPTNNKIHSYMKNHLNKTTDIINPEQINHTYYWGFSENTLISVNGGYMYIKDIVDNKLYVDTIYGGVKIEDNSIKWYDYDGVILSGNTLIFDDIVGQWIRVYESTKSTFIDKQFKLYNLITSDNIIPVNTGTKTILKCRDMVESFDTELNCYIDNTLLEQVRKSA